MVINTDVAVVLVVVVAVVIVAIAVVAVVVVVHGACDLFALLRPCFPRPTLTPLWPFPHSPCRLSIVSRRSSSRSSSSSSSKLLEPTW